MTHGPFPDFKYRLYMRFRGYRNWLALQMNFAVDFVANVRKCCCCCCRWPTSSPTATAQSWATPATRRRTRNSMALTFPRYAKPYQIWKKNQRFIAPPPPSHTSTFPNFCRNETKPYQMLNKSADLELPPPPGHPAGLNNKHCKEATFSMASTFPRLVEMNPNQTKFWTRNGFCRISGYSKGRIPNIQPDMFPWLDILEKYIYAPFTYCS